MNDYITNIATVRITAEDNIIIKIQLRTHFNQVLYSTLAIDRPPITTPEVGVNRLITPEAAEKIITITAGLKPIWAVRGPMIPIEALAKPEVDGIKNDNNKYSK